MRSQAFAPPAVASWATISACSGEADVGSLSTNIAGGDDRIVELEGGLVAQHPGDSERRVEKPTTTIAICFCNVAPREGQARHAAVSA